MNKTNFILSFCLMMALSTVAKENDNRQLFDFGWTFTKIVNGQSSTAQTVNLPHDWDIYAGPNPGKGATGTGGGWYEGGIGEYRKVFTLPSSRSPLHSSLPPLGEQEGASSLSNPNSSRSTLHSSLSNPNSSRSTLHSSLSNPNSSRSTLHSSLSNPNSSRFTLHS
ncbi:MAG: hypothetical protein IJT28_02665, partial [Bacteroidaceae bacterium]|nr:hypothetical protein [Bacteroidaceae bacterium]